MIIIIPSLKPCVDPGGPGARRGDDRRDDAVRILEAGIDAAMPSVILPRVLRRGSIVVGRHVIKTSGYAGVRVVAFGKAALSMTKAFDSRIRVRDGVVVVPRGVAVPRRSRFDVMQSTHPDPSEASVRAARAVLSYIRGCGPADLVVFLVSGGASALVALPDGVTLGEKAKTNGLLLRSGASIAEVNCVRKHLSGIKGGRVTEALPCEAVALVMSDVKANDMSAIASGTTYCDRTTFAQAVSVLRRHRIYGEVPRAVVRRLEAGARGDIPETPKRPRIRNFVVGSNRDCLAAMKREARRRGYAVRSATAFGKIEGQARALARIAPTRRGGCVVFGGETTVLVRSRRGRGGRNQEMALRVGSMLRGDVLVGSVGTDGIDGNTEFAGAMINAADLDRAAVRRYLQTSNSNGYLRRYGGLIKTGPTQTNLLDIGIMLY